MNENRKNIDEKASTRTIFGMFVVLILLTMTFLAVKETLDNADVRKDNADICRAKGYDGYKEVDRVCGCTVTITNNVTGERWLVVQEFNDLLNTEGLCCGEGCAR